MPVLIFLDKIGFTELKKLKQAVDTMKAGMIDVIAVRPRTVVLPYWGGESP